MLASKRNAVGAAWRTSNTCADQMVGVLNSQPHRELQSSTLSASSSHVAFRWVGPQPPGLNNITKMREYLTLYTYNATPESRMSFVDIFVSPRAMVLRRLSLRARSLSLLFVFGRTRLH